MKEIDPIICFDSIQTLRKHLKDLQPNNEILVTPNDFTKGTTCINATFSSQLKAWGLKWSYSTAFYPGESPFSNLLAKRIEKAPIFNRVMVVNFKSHRQKKVLATRLIMIVR